MTTSRPGKQKTFSLISDATLRNLYARMLECRILGQSTRGLEAVYAGATAELRPADALFCTQERLARFLSGAAPDDGLHPIPGRKPQKDLSLPEQIALATGASVTVARRKPGAVTVALLAKSKGTLKEAQTVLRFAAANKLPLLYVCSDIAEDATSLKCDFPLIPVDNKDVVAIYRVAYECILRARQGQGPSMIVGSSWIRKSDPLRNMEHYLAAKGILDDGWKQQLQREMGKKWKPLRAPRKTRPSLAQFACLYDC